MALKKLLSLICVLLLLAGLCPAHAQQETPRTLMYTGGVVQRIVPRAESTLLEAAYTLTDIPYILLNTPCTWEIFVEGGTKPYQVDVLLAHQADLSMHPFQDPWTVTDWFTLDGMSFDYTFIREGRYSWQFEIKDAAGQKMVFQTRIYEAYREADETDPTTTVGKVNQMIDELITDSMSDYTRALVLHDWLIQYANYDYTLQNSDASGVLIDRSGTCDSYARAYLMLCTAAGLECMYVSGTAGNTPDVSSWGNHAWNLVRLGGSWYHVDCTWDDPGTGGHEQHVYFCVDDETMRADHRWNRPDDVFRSDGILAPEAEGGEFESSETSAVDYDFTFTTWEEFEAAFDQMVASGERRAKTCGLYTGPLSPSQMYSSMGSWASAKVQQLANAGLITGVCSRGCSGNLFRLQLTWVSPTSYLRIDETAKRLSVGEKATIVPSETQPMQNVFEWTSSDPAVVSVSPVFDASASAPVTAVMTALKAGTATITATSPDGAQDSIAVTVLAPHQPEFDLTLSDDLTLSWNSIPGVTAYHVMRLCDDQTSRLLTTASTSAKLSPEQLPSDAEQQLSIVAQRVVNGSVRVSYQSEYVSYGTLTIDYSILLPGNAREIGTEAFAGNESLTAVFLPDGLLSIGEKAFAGCSGLTAVRIPASVAFITDDAFDQCPLRYAEVVKGSPAEDWFNEHLPRVRLIY